MGTINRKVILPPNLFLICIGCMFILWWQWPILTIISFPYNLIGIIFIVLGLAVSIWGSRKFATVGTNINTFDEPDILVTDGLYKYTRNPMYLGFSVALLGTSLIFGAISTFIILLAFIFITDRWYIQYEERMLSNEFGEEYEKYKKQTRRWL